jgi:phage gp29-like protein
MAESYDTTDPIFTEGLPKAITEPVIQLTARDRLYQEVRRRLLPNEVEGVLASAIDGSLYYQGWLFNIMLDTWPRLQKDLRELTQAVLDVGLKIKPWAKKDEEPTDSAIEKADLVERSTLGCRADITWRERSWEGLLKDIITSWLLGFAVNEIYWEVRKNEDSGDLEYQPRCFKPIPPRFFRYPMDVNEPDRLLLNPSGNFGNIQLFDWPANKFVVSINEGHTGHPSMAAPIRCLSVLWSASVFGMSWFQSNAQLFGVPFRIGKFVKGDAQAYQILSQMLASMGSSGWAAIPTDTSIELLNLTGQTAGGPSERLVEFADKICDIFVLGQTLTTDVQASGSRALGQVHHQVKSDLIDAVLKYVGFVLTDQYSRALIALNYGPDEKEIPSFELDREEPIDEKTIAERDAILFGNSTGQLGLPVSLEFLYDRHRVPAPEEGEQLFEPGGIMPPEPAAWSEEPGGNGNGDGQGVTPAMPSERQLAPGVQPKQAEPPSGAMPGTGVPFKLKPAKQTGVPAKASHVSRWNTRWQNIRAEHQRKNESSENSLSSVASISGDLSDDKSNRPIQIGARRTPSFHKELAALPDRGPAEEAAASSLEDYFKENAASIKSIRWKSVIDERTTPVCKQLHNRVWSYPGLKPRGGHSIPFPGFPPILYNCRSTALPVLKTFPAIRSWFQQLLGAVPKRTLKPPYRYKEGTLPALTKEKVNALPHKGEPMPDGSLGLLLPFMHRKKKPPPKEEE